MIPSTGHSVQRIAITGGAGRIASALRRGLSRSDRELVLLDIRKPDPPADAQRHESFTTVDLTDLDALTAAFSRAQAVIHLGGFASERPWHEILAVNIDGTRTVLEAARRSGVPSVVLASSIHAVGMTPTDAVAGIPLPFPRPDSFYGVGKVTMEALGSVYADRCGLRVLSLRIANFATEPDSHRGLALWLSPGDMTRAVDAFLADEAPGHRIAWGVSANSRSPVDASEGERFGFIPVDDAERFADRVPTSGEPWDRYLGGDFLAPGNDLGEAP